MHKLACELRSRHIVQVVTQWNTQRTDWLWGTTIRAPKPAHAYVIDDIPVNRITLSQKSRWRLLPWVLAYYPLQHWALPQIANALVDELMPLALNADIVHNCRAGREGLSYASFKLARQRDIPFIFTPVHHPRWGGWLHRYYHSLYRQADAVIALTEAERRILVSLGVEERKVFVTGMGPVLSQDRDGRRFRETYELGDAPLVLFIGKKFAYKGVAILLEAAEIVWRYLPQIRFIFIGPRTTYSRRLFLQVKDRRILELGEVDLQEKTDALDACDVFCLPSSQESFGAVFTEAWSLGKPVVGCDIPAVREVIDDGQDGFVVPRQTSAIAKSLIYLLENDDLKTQMGNHGRNKVKRRFMWSILAEKAEQTYQSVLRGVL